MAAPFGDYILRRFTVDCLDREIRLQAEWPFETRADMPQYTELVFKGVEAYQFEHDNFQTILGWVIERPLDSFVDKRMPQFKSGYHASGWPQFWDDSPAKILSYLQERSVRAYEIVSSFGMEGWVLAREMSTREVDATRLEESGPGMNVT